MTKAAPVYQYLPITEIVLLMQYSRDTKMFGWCLKWASIFQSWSKRKPRLLARGFSSTHIHAQTHQSLLIYPTALYSFTDIYTESRRQSHGPDGLYNWSSQDTFHRAGLDCTLSNIVYRDSAISHRTHVGHTRTNLIVPAGVVWRMITQVWQSNRVRAASLGH